MKLPIIDLHKAKFFLAASILFPFSELVIAQNRVSAGGEGMEQCIELVRPGSTSFDISAAPQPTEGIVIPRDTVIGKTVFTRYPIFDANDPEENNALFRLADTLHIDTKENVIEDHLLFEKGDTLDMRLLSESARILRDQEYLYDARVWPYRICDNVVDIEVLTREVWTLYGGFSVSKEGGNDETTISVSDSNFLGRGELVSFTRTDNTDRSGYEFVYSDPTVSGTHHTLDLLFADNSDGHDTYLKAERPFYALDTRQAWGLRYRDKERVEDVYDRGEEVASYLVNENEANIFMGFSSGWKNGITKRWWLGLHSEEETYTLAPDDPPPADFPVDDVLKYPYVTFGYIEEDFIKVSNLNAMHRIEDFNSGQSWEVSLGWASESFGSKTDRLVFYSEWRDAWQLSERSLAQIKTELSGRWLYSDDAAENVEFSTYWRYYNGVNSKFGTYLALDTTWRRKARAGQQVLLGADEGLRGYPARYQEGDRSFRFTIEQRYYTDWHLYRLMRVGFAAFFDVGRAWRSDDPNDDATGVLADAGFGLRFGSTRGQSKQVLHVDIAFPFTKLDDIDNYQLLLTARRSF